MLQPITDGLWSTTRPQRFLGLETGTRMTIVRLANGGLFVHSPVGLDPPLRAEVDALGPVTAIVASSLFHNLYVGEWRAAYPNAIRGSLRDQLAEAEEHDAVAHALGAAPRGRRVTAHAERARLTVTKGVGAALAKIREAHPLLGRHLAATVRRGYVCVYDPDPRHPIVWDS